MTTLKPGDLEPELSRVCECVYTLRHTHSLSLSQFQCECVIDCQCVSGRPSVCEEDLVRRLQGEGCWTDMEVDIGAEVDDHCKDEGA